MPKTYALIACTKDKHDGPLPARELYAKSRLFQAAYQYAKKVRGVQTVYILSAKYHLLHEIEKISKYEKTLNNMNQNSRREWAGEVLEQMREFGMDLKKDYFIILAGKPYREFLLPHMDQYEIPMEGLKMGQQKRWLNEQLADYRTPGFFK